VRRGRPPGYLLRSLNARKGRLQDHPLRGIEKRMAMLGECVQEKTSLPCRRGKANYSFGAAVGTSSVRMVFIHSAVMVLRSSIDMPA
jgi:hypothetical protein